MIDYVFAVIVGILAAAATGYAYRAAKAAEEVVKKIREWEEAWRQYYYAAWPESQSQKESSISREEPKVEILPSEEEKEEDYVSQLMKRVSCAGELIKSMGGCAPIDEVIDKCGIPKHQLRALFNLKDNKNEVCLRGA